MSFYTCISFAAWMPGPVVFGSIIDNTCLLWKYTCGERLSCQLYDIVYFRIAYHVFGIACKGIGLIMIVGLYIYFRITNKQQWREEQPPARELQLNGEELVKIKVSCHLFYPFFLLSVLPSVWSVRLGLFSFSCLSFLLSFSLCLGGNSI